ncbi:unnamed protein product [Caenorhabditis auriculariae]|uniref:Uncharacterized protein n=1 Tax=Caenorhabditis auriculariae TaxID=2777116 RepID=A0A8S1GMC9_9PELO|nr:unnamed protein product [Caenorhabditis auriculariae]
MKAYCIPHFSDQAVYGAPLVKSRASVSSSSSPLLKAYEIDVSDESLAQNASQASARNELPLIVKPLRKFISNSAKTLEPAVPPPRLVRRTTLKEQPTRDPAPEVHSNFSLPRNFRRPTVLHAAERVDLNTIPFIDDDEPPSSKGFGQTAPTVPRPSIPCQPRLSTTTTAQRAYVTPWQPTSTYFDYHRREDSGYRSTESINRKLPETSVSKEKIGLDDEDELDGDFDWGDEYLNSRRCSLVLRTQTSLRVKTIIDKLLNSSGRDQRRALFSLKQIFQDDQDLVHEFVQNAGLDCMIRLGKTADQNHQNYILRALGQLMLYVDGMNGIIAHNATIQWLYELLDSPFRLVVKTALKLLLVFIEYNDNNALLVMSAISSVDKSKGQADWSGLMKVISEKDSPDAETLVYGMTVINKALNGIPDRDTYYDAVDTLDTLGMEEAIKTMSRSNNRELQEQCRLYERELKEEDEREESDEDLNVKMRPQPGSQMTSPTEYNPSDKSKSSLRSSVRRPSQESQGSSVTSDPPPEDPRISSSSPGASSPSSCAEETASKSTPQERKPSRQTTHEMPEDIETALQRLERALQQRREAERAKKEEEAARIREQQDREQLLLQEIQMKQQQRYAQEVASTTTPAVEDKKAAMRRRHDDARRRQQEHQQFSNNRSVFNKSPQEEARVPIEPSSAWKGPKEVLHDPQPTTSKANEDLTSAMSKRIPEPIQIPNENQENVIPKENEEFKAVKAPPPSFPTLFSPTESKTMEFPEVQAPPKEEEKAPPPPRAKIEPASSGPGGFAEMLQKRAARSAEANRGVFEKKESEAETQWKKAAENLKSRPLIINDLDFSEFHADEFEQDPLMLARLAQVAESRANGGPMIHAGGGAPPPPPPPPSAIPLPPRLMGNGSIPVAPPLGIIPPPPPNLSNGFRAHDISPAAQNKGVLKMHWKAATVEAPPIPSLKQKGTFWNNVDRTVPSFDANKIVQLFETKKEKESTVKKVAETKTQVLSVLSLKRSQAINIGLTKLPPISVIPAAIMKFDSLVLNKEMIEKILKTMMPAPKEVEEIENKAAENPEMTLGNAEQFLLKLSQIPCLLERLKLWLFTLDYKNAEKDIAEPLMDLQLAMKEMEESKTFKVAMGMLLAIGNSLSGTDIKGFYLDYLTKASEVKDPVYKHTLTYHLAEYMVEHFPEGTDLYSELGAVARSARVDYKELLDNVIRLEKECKASWECLTIISKNDNSSMRQKINDYLADVAQRIHQLKAIYTVTKNRWHAFLLYFGYSVDEIPNQNPNEVFKMVTEFALEYRTTRDKILQQRKRMAEKRERNKTRGKIWALEGTSGEGNESSPMRRRQAPPVAVVDTRQRHEEMSRMLSTTSEGSDGTLRRRAPLGGRTNPVVAPKEMNDNGAESPEDEILNGLVKAATLQTESRDHRRRARQFNRKSLRRTRTLKLVDGQLETCNY